MSLQHFSLVSPALESGSVFNAIESAIPKDIIHQAIEKAGVKEKRCRLLPTHLVICLIVALSFWSRAPVRDVLKNLLEGVGDHRLSLGEKWHIPTRAAITKARQRVGPRVMSTLFNLLTRPVATLQTPGAFLNGLRMVGIDGTYVDVPDSPSNARVFGYPGSRSGTRAAFPKLRLVLLVGLGTHLIFDALMSPYRLGERGKAKRLLRSVDASMVVLWDGGLHSYDLVQATLAQSSHFLGRIPTHVKLGVDQELPDGSFLSYLYPPRKLKKKGYQPIAVRVVSYSVKRLDKLTKKPKNYRLITDLFDAESFPATLLARDVHQRWEEELTIDEFKTHLVDRKVEIRAENPREVIQEVYGLLIGHWVVRQLMAQAAAEAGISPLKLGFTASVRVIRRAVRKFQGLVSEQFKDGFEWLMSELLDEELPERVQRNCPRVVKKQCSKYPPKKMKPRQKSRQKVTPLIPLIPTVAA